MRRRKWRWLHDAAGSIQSVEPPEEYPRGASSGAEAAGSATKATATATATAKKVLKS